MLKRIWSRISDGNRLCYFATTCFGFCLLIAVGANSLGYYLYEGNWVVRGVEIVIGLGLVALGARMEGKRKRRAREQREKEGL